MIDMIDKNVCIRSKIHRNEQSCKKPKSTVLCKQFNTFSASWQKKAERVCIIAMVKMFLQY